MTRRASELNNGFRPVRACFREVRAESAVHWYCQLCTFSYWEPFTSSGWPLTVSGLLLLIKHVKGHTDGH